MTTLLMSDKSSTTTKVDAVVLLTAKTKDGARVVDPHGVSPAVVKAANAALVTLGAKGAADEVVRLPGAGELTCQVLAVGCGVDADAAPGAHAAQRDAAGAAARSLTGVTSVAFAFPVEDGAGLQAVYPVGDGIAGGEHQHWQRFALLA